MPPDGSFMRIATYGRGIWELPQIEFVGAVLTDDKRSCDHDGVLDNGEKGSLRITLKNQGREVENVAVTVTSSNPAVTFPHGNTIQFPGMERNGSGTGSITVALQGAAPVDSTDFNISISAPEIGLTSGFNVVSTHRLNYDEAPAASTTETVEGSVSGWTVTGGAPESPNINSWQRRALSPLNHVWWGPDNNGQIDDVRGSLPDEQSLISPAMHVGTDPLTLSFRHRFSFENGGWDGGVIEISTDDGVSWADIGTAAYNGSTNASTLSPLGTNRKAFVNRMLGWPDFTSVNLNLGTAFAGKDIKIRFRIGADDSTGAPGWDVDDISVGGITNKPFTALVPNACTVKPGDRDDD
jgi:hypothetical protein